MTAMAPSTPASPAARATGPRALSRADVVLLALAAAHVVVKLALFFQLSKAPVVGDEAAYVDGARALSNLVRDLSAFGPVDTAELQRSVVGSGWFMPGMSIVLTPLFVVDPDASITAIRAYLGVVSTLLLLFTVVSVRRVLGDVYAAVLLVFPGLVPMWLLFSYAAWGDLCAGLLVVLLIVQLIAVSRSVRHGAAPTLRDGVKIGLLAIAVVYARSSTSVLVVALCAVIGVAVLVLLRGAERLRAVGSLAVSGVVFLALLAPWSVFASQTLGGRVITTTSVPVVMANTFGDRERLCFGPCDPESTIWFTPLRYSREVAAATGRSEVEVQQQMSAYARADVTPHSYAGDVLANLGRYALDPAGFAPYLASPGNGSGTVVTLVQTVTVVMFFALLAVTLAMLVTVVRRRGDAPWLSMLLKVALAGLLIQPFVHLCGSRYWTTAAPLFGLSAALAWVLLRRSEAVDGPMHRTLTTMQALVVGVMAATALGVVLVAV